MIEAFATGTPVVASTAGSIPEIVQHEVNGLHFTPGNAKDLQHQVVRMFTEPDLHAKTSIGARTSYEQRYTADANHDVLMRTYVEAIESNPPKLEICFA
jgi:glycosyltransferase involved in cell wall biosynthesis